MLALTANIGPGKISVMLAQIAEPSSCCLIVMSTCVNNAIPFISVRQIRTVLILVKSKLQYLHSRESALIYQMTYGICHISQVLCDNLLPSKRLFNLTEQINSGTFFPMTVSCSGISIRNREIFIKATEMVDSDYIIEIKCVRKTLYPPCITGLAVIIPAVKRISP